MSEYYKDIRVASAQRKDDISDVPVGPRYKGLPRDVVEANTELAWMLEAEQADVVTAGSQEGELTWVLADDWNSWREANLD